MQFRPLKKDEIVVQAKNFNPTWPHLVSIQFDDQTVTVRDTQNQEHILPFSQVEICETIDPRNPL